MVEATVDRCEAASDWSKVVRALTEGCGVVEGNLLMKSDKVSLLKISTSISRIRDSFGP